MAGFLYRHPIQGAFSQVRQGYRKSPGSQRARPAPRGQGGANWSCCCPNNLSGNPSRRPPVLRSKASQLTLCPGIQKPHSPLLPKPVCRMHNTSPLPHHQPSSSLNWETTLPRICSWPSSFLLFTHSVCPVKLVLHCRRAPCFRRQQTVWVCVVDTALQGPCIHQGERHEVQGSGKATFRKALST